MSASALSSGSNTSFVEDRCAGQRSGSSANGAGTMARTFQLSGGNVPTIYPIKGKRLACTITNGNGMHGAPEIPSPVFVVQSPIRSANPTLIRSRAHDRNN
jgi:hypothetical protein